MIDHQGRRLRVLREGEGAPRGAEPAKQAIASADRGSLDRRRFLKMVGASIALAELSGCTRQPPEHIVPYVRQPEDAPPGVSQYYATSMIDKGHATGLLVRSETGRPIKVEGNPDHPSSLGATDAFAQASVLSLYDPDRSRVLTRLGRITTWSRFSAELAAAVTTSPGRGAGIRILTETCGSPSLAAEIAALLRLFPEAKWCRYEPAGLHHTMAGARLAFGAPLSTRHDLAAADVVLTLESDLLAQGPGNLRNAHDFASRRGAGRRSSADPVPPGAALPPNRLYSIESTPTLTGTMADHRLTLRPSEVAAFVSALAAELGVFRDASAADISSSAARWAAVIAKDLRAHRGRSLIACGEPAPPAIHAFTAVLNEALGNTGSTVLHSDPVEIDPVDHIASLRELTEDMRAGRVSVLLILGGNPVYTAPADLDFAGALDRVPLRVHLSLFEDETSAYCHYHVPEAHFLESWGDGRAHDGTTSLVQPLLDPLYSGKTAIELVAAMRGGAPASGMDLVRGHLRAAASLTDEAFRSALRDGFVRGSALPVRRVDIAVDAAQKASLAIAAAARDRGGYELCLRPDPTIDDGRFSHNGWLQELPKPHTSLTWDNAAILSPRTAAELDVQTGDVLELAREGRSVMAAAYVLRCQPDATVTAHLGYGRSSPAGRGGGFDAYRLRSSQSLWHGPGLVIRKTGERYPLATTQAHFTLEGRAPVRSTTLEELASHPDIVKSERPREPSTHPGPAPEHAAHERPLSLYPDWPQRGRQWGMSIDLGACTGCSACVVACEAENNSPVVGKAQIEAGREMHWLRIDRYEVGPGDHPPVIHQPMMCAHCETAPCEYVCPVEATSHSADGLNEMTYNRCVGTRYCSNNCPYKVRRFNFFEYHGDDRTGKLGHNPDVTVRSRGVMEKCTYCVQRISAGRIKAERDQRPLPDGEVITACQQACPTGAIVFGDIHDPAALVTRLKADPRSYGVLEDLSTRPRTTYLARVRNPNPELDDRG